MLEAKHDTARNLLASLLTRHGEHIFRIGEGPTHANLFNGELSDRPEGWTGTPRSAADIEALRQGIMDNTREIGGKVGIGCIYAR